MKSRFIYTFLQWTWGILQNLVGFFLLLLNINKKHTIFKGAIVTSWNLSSCLGCGMFIFVHESCFPRVSPITNKMSQNDVLVHEYGHTIQSIILGPLFLLVIALPSVTWAGLPLFKKMRCKKGISYYWLYCEKWANVLGDKICHHVRKDD